MSYFLAGLFHFSRALSYRERIDTAFKLSEKALQKRLALQLAPNVAQPVVFEILEKRVCADDELIFLLTASPISDTSDDIVAYWGESHDEMAEKIRGHVETIKGFLTSIKTIERLGHVTLFVSEGYDTDYQQERVTLASLAERFIALAADYDWLGFPSVRLSISLNES